MTNLEQERLERRVIVLTPTGKDAALTESVLGEAGIDCFCCSTLQEVCDQLDAGAAAVLLAEEPIIEDRNDCLTEWLNRQPPWSDLPILVAAWSGADSAAVAQAMDLLGNVTVLERPTRVATLVSAIRTALRARQRQYQTRVQLAERERGIVAQARLAAIVASSDDAIISKTLDGVIQTWNRGAERIFGYSTAEVIGQSIKMLIPPERHDEEDALLVRLRRGERIEHLETVRLTKDGRLIDISLSVSPLLSPDGTIIGASKVARDITERKRNQQQEQRLLTEAASANAKFRAFFEQGTFFAAIMEVDGTVIDVSRLFLKECGVNRDQVVGSLFWNSPQWMLSAEIVEQIKGAFAQAAAGETFSAELPYLVVGARQRILELTILPIMDEAGQVLYLASIGLERHRT